MFVKEIENACVRVNVGAFELVKKPARQVQKRVVTHKLSTSHILFQTSIGQLTVLVTFFISRH